MRASVSAARFVSRIFYAPLQYFQVSFISIPVCHVTGIFVRMQAYHGSASTSMPLWQIFYTFTVIRTTQTASTTIANNVKAIVHSAIYIHQANPICISKIARNLYVCTVNT